MTMARRSQDWRVRGRLRAALGALGLLGLGSLACSTTTTSPGGFEDDLGEDTGPVPPDLPESECDPRRPDGCDEGQKCSHVDDTELGSLNRCVAIHGEGLAGEACEHVGDSDTCANHHICWATDAEGQGVCKEFCSPALDCEDDDDLCSVSNAGTLSLCLRRCDPLAAISTCPRYWGCYPDDYLRWACDRDQSGEAGGHGSGCACINCCDPGFICLPGALVDAEGCGDEDTPGCCGAVCEVGEGLPVEGVCPVPTETCSQFYPGGEAPLGYDHVGVCEL